MSGARAVLLLLLSSAVWGCGKVPDTPNEAEPMGRGPYAVGSTNLEIAAEFVDIGDDAMHSYLLGIPKSAGQPRYVADILKHPEDETRVRVPYGSPL